MKTRGTKNRNSYAASKQASTHTYTTHSEMVTPMYPLVKGHFPLLVNIINID